MSYRGGSRGRGRGGSRGGRGRGGSRGGRGRGRGGSRGGRGRGRGRGRGGGRGRGRGRGRGGKGMKGGSNVIVERHRHEGIFIAKGKGEDALVTLNFAPGVSVYGEKRITIEKDEKKNRIPCLESIPFEISRCCRCW